MSGQIELGELLARTQTGNQVTVLDGVWRSISSRLLHRELCCEGALQSRLSPSLLTLSKNPQLFPTKLRFPFCLPFSCAVLPSGWLPADVNACGSASCGLARHPCNKEPFRGSSYTALHADFRSMRWTEEGFLLFYKESVAKCIHTKIWIDAPLETLRRKQDIIS